MDLQETVRALLNDYGYLVYLITVAWAFLEGETFVIILGAFAATEDYNLNIEAVALAALLGSFAGDQFYYYIGRRYGRSLLSRWPTLKDKIEWTFRMVRQNETLFILSFRFIYGIRNISPFVIGMSGVSRLKYFALNLIAATIWAHTFAWGGYLLGAALEYWLGEYKFHILGAFVVLFASVAFINWRRARKREIENQKNGDIPAP